MIIVLGPLQIWWGSSLHMAHRQYTPSGFLRPLHVLSHHWRRVAMITIKYEDALQAACRVCKTIGLSSLVPEAYLYKLSRILYSNTVDHLDIYAHLHVAN